MKSEDTLPPGKPGPTVELISTALDAVASDYFSRALARAMTKKMLAAFAGCGHLN